MKYQMRSRSDPAMGRVLRNKPAIKSYREGAEDDQNCGRENYDLSELKKNYRAVQEENFKLQAVITDVTEVNKRWQKYNNDRQMYVQKLLSTIQDQQEQMNRIIGEKSLYSKDNIKEDEAASRTLQFEEEIRLLQERLEQQEKEHKEHISVLEYQLKAHRDDWEAEHNEKEQSLRDKAATEARLHELENELHSVRLKLKDVLNRNTCSNCRRLLTQADDLENNQLNFTNTFNKYDLLDKSKTYRSSVQLPDTLVSKGASPFFDHDLVTDGTPTHHQRRNSQGKETTQCERLIAMDQTFHSKTAKSKEDYLLLGDLQPSSSTSADTSKRTECEKYTGLRNSMSKLNIQPSTNSNHKIGSSNLRFSPHGSNGVTSNFDGISKGSDGNVVASGGVAIGFSSDGLVSVTAFPRKRIIKSMSLPSPSEPEEDNPPTEICNSASDDITQAASRWPASKMWPDLSVVAAPPMEESSFKSSKHEKLTLNTSSGNKDVTEVHRTSTRRANYYEEGVATQTEEDVICPSCGQIFPPKLHLMFLDHFETCQNNLAS